jgi:hypothetical protein
MTGPKSPVKNNPGAPWWRHLYKGLLMVLFFSPRCPDRAGLIRFCLILWVAALTVTTEAPAAPFPMSALPARSILIQIQTKTPPPAPKSAPDKVIPFSPPETVEQWLDKYKLQGWAKCRMSALDTFGVTAGKASTEVFVAMRQLTDGMEEVEKLLETRGVETRAMKSALQAEAHLISVMTLEQKGALFRECVHSLW